MDKRERLWIGILAGIFAHLTLAGAGTVAFAATMALPSENESAQESLNTRAQRLLTSLGLYTGPIDGRITAGLATAIRRFQLGAGAGQAADGQVTPELITLLEAADRMRTLGRELDQLGREQAERARQALLSQPATRDLVEPPPPSDAARPTSNTALLACLATPTPACLLEEAVAVSARIDVPRLRDWALVEIVEAQGRAGLYTEARNSVRRLSDPRSIVASLRELAILQARRGDFDAAMNTAASIPEPGNLVEATLGIATQQLAHGDARSAAATLARAEPALARTADGIPRISLLARTGALYARAGAGDRAISTLAAAETMARGLPSREARRLGLGFVATELAESGRPDEAAALIGTGPGIAPASLSALAAAHARRADADAAIRAAELIDEPRFRAVAIARLAQELRSPALLASARRAAASIDEPILRDFPFNRIAAVHLALGERALALQLARTITDASLRAQTLWLIAGNDEALLGEAERAADQVPVPLDRAWLYAEIAQQRREAGDPAGARRAMARAIDLVSTIEHPPSRARGFARLATMVIENP